LAEKLQNGKKSLKMAKMAPQSRKIHGNGHFFAVSPKYINQLVFLSALLGFNRITSSI
jgi:hypothetical protein